jgi:RNA polymerase sigma factor for flagellar operon FliA
MGLTGRQASELMSELNASQLLHLEGRAASQDRNETAFVDVLTDEGAEPEAELIASAELEALNEAMETLSEREHTVLFLAFFGGLTQEQIGRIIKVGGPQVCKIHATALRKLRSVLGGSRIGLEQALAS